MPRRSPQRQTHGSMGWPGPAAGAIASPVPRLPAERQLAIRDIVTCLEDKVPSLCMPYQIHTSQG